MEAYDKLLEDIEAIVGRISELYELAYEQYSHVVDEVLAGTLKGEKQIEQILDGIVIYCNDNRFLELSKKLCRNIYYQYPHLAVGFVQMYRRLIKEKKGDDEHWFM